jgi:hypothetical protein
MAMIGPLIESELMIGGSGSILFKTDVPHSMAAWGGDNAALDGADGNNVKNYNLLLQESLEFLLFRTEAGQDYFYRRGAEGAYTFESAPPGVGMLDKFIVRDYEDLGNGDYLSDGMRGLYLKPGSTTQYGDALSELLGGLVGLVLPIVAGSSVDPSTLATMSFADQVGLLVNKVVLPMIPDLNYMRIPADATTLRQLGTYILVDMLSDILPEKKYDLTTRNRPLPADGSLTQTQVFYATAGAALEYKSTPTQLNPHTDGVFVALADLLRYYLNPLMPSLNLPENQTFDGMMNALIGWALGSFGGLLREVPAAGGYTTTGWDRITYLLFGPGGTDNGAANAGILRKDWLPTDIAQESPLLKKLLVDHLVGAVLDLDFTKLFSLFRSYENKGGGGGELERCGPIQLVLHVVARLLNSVLKVPTSSTIIDWNFTTLDQLLSGSNSVNGLGTLVRMLCEQIGQIDISSSILGGALPLLASLLGMWSEADFLPHMTEEMVPYNATPEMVRTKLNQILPSEQSVEWYDPAYIHFGPENVKFEFMYRYNMFSSARSAASALLDRYDALTDDDPENDGEMVLPTQMEWDDVWVKLGFYTDGSVTFGGRSGEPITTSLRNSLSVQNGGLEFQHLLETLQRVQAEDYKYKDDPEDPLCPPNWTSTSWAVYSRAYEYANDLIERYYNMDLTRDGQPFITQAMITRSRHELNIAEKQLAAFKAMADYVAFDAALLQLESVYLEREYYIESAVNELVAVLTQAREFPLDYESGDQSKVNAMVEKMTLVLALLQNGANRRLLLHAKSGAAVATFEELSPYPGTNLGATPPPITRVLYRVPQGFSSAGGKVLHTNYVERFGQGTSAIYTASAIATKGGVTYLGTGSCIALGVQAGKGTQARYDDGVRVLVFGDVNGDAMCDAQDAIRIDMYLAGKMTLDRLQEEAADVNDDGPVDSLDREIMRQSGLGKHKFDLAKLTVG